MSKTLRLPGLIDIHVHFRDPGQTHKEDFFTGSSAALAGGVTTVFDMPNNQEPILTHEKLLEKLEVAKQKAVCDFGLYFGTDGKNTDQFEKVIDKVIGLKVYLGVTTGKLVIEDEELVKRVFENWPKNKVIAIHAEGEKVDLAINLGTKFGNKIHITHMATKKDLEKIIEAKKNKCNVTCDTTPHYLLLTDTYLTQNPGFGQVKPPLASKNDQDYLWDHLSDIDCIASDHAPHTTFEKQSANPPSGMPGLETMLPLLLNAIKQGRISIEEIIRLTNTDPQKIFDYKQDKETYMEVDPDEEWMVENKNLKTKCRWSPFERWKVKGKVKRVFIRGWKVFENGKILANQGFGKNLL
jgi:carbamoyl-phosphate synthase/aspartate carbamoyltransferase/dihydroorotase